MDFIERWFGMSPDGGSGSLELTIIAAIVIVLAGIGLILRTSRKSSPDRK